MSDQRANGERSVSHFGAYFAYMFQVIYQSVSMHVAGDGFNSERNKSWLVRPYHTNVSLFLGADQSERGVFDTSQKAYLGTTRMGSSEMAASVLDGC